jgi:hypothetical protein
MGECCFRQFEAGFSGQIFLAAGEVEQAHDLPEHIFLGAESGVFLRSPVFHVCS